MARVRLTLYAQVGNDEPVPLGFRMIDDALTIKADMVTVLRQAADLIEPQAQIDAEASTLLKQLDTP